MNGGHLEHLPPPAIGKPPGWYPAPSSPNDQLYWTGSAWTARRRWTPAGYVTIPISGRSEPSTAAAPITGARASRILVWIGVAVVVVVVAGGTAIFVAGGLSGGHHKTSPSGTSTTARYTSARPAAEGACLAFIHFYNDLAHGPVLSSDIAKMRDDLAPMQPAAHQAAQLSTDYRRLSQDADDLAALVDTFDFSYKGPGLAALNRAPALTTMLDYCSKLPG